MQKNINIKLKCNINQHILLINTLILSLNLYICTVLVLHKMGIYDNGCMIGIDFIIRKCKRSKVS